MSTAAKEKAIQEIDQFEALFQYASMGILVTDNHAAIIMVNNFLLGQFGYNSADELIGKKIEVLIPMRYHDKHVGHRDQYNKSPQRRPMGLAGMDLSGLRKDGTEFPVEVSLSNYQTSDGNCTIAFVIDITKRKETELETLRQKEELAGSNRRIEEMNNELEQKVELRTKELQESKDELSKALSKEKDLSDLKSRFVSMASHEFRTPLSTILSSASLVAKYTQTEEQDKRDKHVFRIKSSVQNLTDLLNEFLSIGKMEDGKVQAHLVEFNIKELLEAVCTEMQSLAKTGQLIEISHYGDKIVTLDASLLRNILINLLSNAIKFSPEGGKINVSCNTENQQVAISIKDSGIGISAEDQEHLFERFFRAANAVNIQGTGLGLHIVGKYIELMNGQISYTSELEKGTEFVIKFNAS